MYAPVKVQFSKEVLVSAILASGILVTGVKFFLR